MQLCKHHECAGREVIGVHAVSWKCSQGHRIDNYYCDAHIDRMMELALGVAEGRLKFWPACIVCEECGRSNIMWPVLEGIP